MMGLCVGLMIGAGPAMVLLVPLVLSFVFMVTAWTYCLRGWLAALMVNKRRRRAIIVWVTIVFVGLCQAAQPGLQLTLLPQADAIGRNGGSNARPPGAKPPAATRGVRCFRSLSCRRTWPLPPGWIGYGAMTLKEHNPWPALACNRRELPHRRAGADAGLPHDDPLLPGCGRARGTTSRRSRRRPGGAECCSLSAVCPGCRTIRRRWRWPRSDRSRARRS